MVEILCIHYATHHLLISECEATCETVVANVLEIFE